MLATSSRARKSKRIAGEQAGGTRYRVRERLRHEPPPLRTKKYPSPSCAILITPSREAAAKAGMDAKTARKYRRLGRVPSELTPGPRWRTREDCFQEVWKEVQSLLEVNAGLEAKTIFEYLQRRYAGRFADGQLRTLQRRSASARRLGQ
jgi:hypothetical protein